MNKKIKGIAVIFMCITFILSLDLISENVSAKAQDLLTGKKVEIGNFVYKFTNEKYDYWDFTKEATIVQYSKVTKGNLNLVKKATSVNIVTNGRELYYSKNKVDKSVIYKMDLKTKKISKITSINGNGYEILGGADQYLYIGVPTMVGSFGYTNVFVYNMKAKKRVREIDYPVGSFHINHGRLLIDQAQSDADNYTLEIATLLGRRIFQTKAMGGFFAKGKMYYVQIFYHKNGETLKCYQCDLNGKNRKRIKEKTFNEYGEKYWNISNIL